MVWKFFKRWEPQIVSLYRWISSPPVPNLSGDRAIEYSWIAAHLPSGPGQALELGNGKSYLGLAAVRRGFEVVALDLIPVAWSYLHPRLHFVQQDIFEAQIEPESLDLVINCSTIEHIGLGRYGDSVDADGDLKAMELLHDALKPGGVMLLTIPVGRDAIHKPYHRVYGMERLPLLLDSLALTNSEFWVKNEENRWIQTDELTAMQSTSSQHCYGLGCFMLKR